MSATPLLLFGAGGHAHACIDVVEQDGRFAVGGLVGLPEEVGGMALGYPVLATDDDAPRVAYGFGHGLVTLGQIKTPSVRMRLFEALLRMGLEAPVIVSPRAYVSRHAELGAGTIVMHGAVVNAGARVGRNCIVNSLALVEHDVTVEDHCHVSTHAAINSGVRIGAGSFIGSGASVRQGATIGARSVIGMGQRVLRDCAEGAWLPARRGA